MKNWSHSDSIALGSLLVGIIACIAAVFVVPEVRLALKLDTGKVITPNATLDSSTPDTAYSAPTFTLTLIQVQETLQNPIPSFENIQFCLDVDLDKNIRSCRTNQSEFTSPISRINVSWEYKNAYRGMLFSRKWYWNGELFREVNNDIWDDNWTIDGVYEYTYLDVSNGNIFSSEYVFRPGEYIVELYIDNRLIQSGNFVIR